MSKLKRKNYEARDEFRSMFLRKTFTKKQWIVFSAIVKRENRLLNEKKKLLPDGHEERIKDSLAFLKREADRVRSKI